MKRKIPIIIVIISLLAAATPLASRAAVRPYFMAVNDTLLPFNDDTMPFVSGGEILVPHGMFSGVAVHSVASADLERVRLHRGPTKLVDFFTATGVTLDQDGAALQWPAARRIGGRFYVPAEQVCDFFGLTYEIIDISRDIIPQEQMRVIRITSGGGLNGKTFVGMNSNAIRDAYNDYYAPPPPPPSQPTTTPNVTSPQPSVEELPPVYSDVTIHLSFYDVSAGGTDVLLEQLEAYDSYGYQFCFFVTAGNIANDPGLIRRISGSGHMIGIWLEKGTLDEYYEASALLFEAAKLKTVLISANDDVKAVPAAGHGGLVFWGTSRSLEYSDTLSLEEVTEMIPRESGARQNLISSCSENAVLMLSGIFSYLREFEYTVASITETVEPAG